MYVTFPSLGPAIGPLEVAIHVVQNRRAGEQKSHRDKINKESYILKLCMSFVCRVPVRLLLTSTAVLYHVNGYLQRAYYLLCSVHSNHLIS